MSVKKSIKLTANDKKVLHYLIEHGRMADSETARKLRITPQAILKIRTKLEKAGIIEGYRPMVNYKNLGVNVMAWTVVKYLPAVWEEYSESELNEKLRKHPYIIWGCRVPESDATHILLYGFRDLKQMDEHFMRIQTKLSKILDIKNIYSFSVEQLIKYSPQSLFHTILEDKDFFSESLFLDKLLSKKRKK